MDKFTPIIISSLRIFATGSIFIFHILGLYEMKKHHLDFISILIFCFLTGYFSTKVKSVPLFWLKKRIFSIMIPYWIVIIPALILNRILSYKNTSFLTDAITLLGGNLFLHQSVYVIAWYITFILLLYGFIFLQSFAKTPLTNSFIWIIGFMLFHIAFHKGWYFISLGLGYSFTKIIPPPSKIIANKGKLNRVFFVLQDHCYAFFLIHGGVLLLLSQICKFSLIFSLIWGFILSGVGAITLNKISKKLLTLLFKKMILYNLSFEQRII